MFKKKIAFLFLFILILATYFNSLGHDFVFDDKFVILENSTIHSLKNIPTILGFSDRLIFRPIREITLAVDYFFYNYNPAGYHFSNILFLFLTCCVVYLISFLFFKNSLLAFFTSVIFAVHPIHTEAVSYISGRKDSLAALFYFLGFYFFVKYRETNRKTFFILTLINYILSIFSKEVGLTLPVVLFLFDYYNIPAPSNCKGIKQITNTIKAVFKNHAALYASMALSFLVFFIYILIIRSESGINYMKPLHIYGAGETLNIFTQIKITGIYLKLLLFPISLNADYTFNAIPQPSSLFDLQVIVYLSLVLLLIFIVAIFINTSKKVVSFFLLSLLSSMLPIVQIVKYPEIISERSLFIPSLFYCLLLTSFVGNIWHISKHKLILIFLLFTIVFSVRTIERNFDWKDSETLWKKTVKTSPLSSRAHYNLGTIYGKSKRYKEAKAELVKSLEISPEELITIPDYTINALLNLGNVYYSGGKNQEAIEMYKKVLKLDPANKSAQRNIKLAATTHYNNHSVLKEE